MEMEPTLGTASLQRADQTPAPPRQADFPARGIVYDVGAIETRAQHCCFGDFAAVATGDTALIDVRNRIVAQRIR